MRALRSAPIGLVFFLLTLTYIDVGYPELIDLAECVVMLMHLTRGVS